MLLCAALALHCGSESDPPEVTAASETTRPAWTAGATPPLGASCSREQEDIVCVGASSRAASEATALTEARNAAVDAFVAELAQQIGPGSWQGYSAQRRDDLAALARDEDRVREGQAAVARSLSQQQSLTFDQLDYSERYAGTAESYLAFVSLRLPLSELDRLAAAYGAKHDVLGARVRDFFPGAAWRFHDLTAGAAIEDVGSGLLGDFGLADGYVVLAVQDQPTATSQSFAERATEAFGKANEQGGAVKLLVKTGDTPPLIYNKPLSRPVRNRGRDRGPRPYRGIGDFPPHPTPPGWNDDPTQGPRQ